MKPFFWIKEDSLKPSFIFFAILAVIVMIAMKITGTPMETSLTPSGVVNFEFCWTVESAKAMMAAWEEKHPGYGRIYAAYNMGLDNLFLFVYSHAIGLGCMLVGQKIVRWKKIAYFLAWLLIIAALLDLVENYGLIQLLLGSENEFFPKLSYICAIPKFIFVLAGWLFAIIGYFKKP